MVDEEAKNTYYIYDANKVNVIKEVKPLNGTDIYDGTDLERFAITDFEYYQNGLLKYKLTQKETGQNIFMTSMEI